MKWTRLWLLLTIPAVAVLADPADYDPMLPFRLRSLNELDKTTPGARTEPVYKVHALRVWLGDVMIDSSRMPQPLEPEAAEAIAHIGSNAAPWLVKFLRESATIGFGENGIIPAFQILGPQARAAIPDLADLAVHQQNILRPANALAHGWEISGNAPMEALAAIGPEAFPAVFRILTNATSPGLRLAAINSIGCYGTNAAPALPELLKWVGDTNEMLAEASVSAVGEVGRHQPAALAAISNALDSPNLMVRESALNALERFGCEANPLLIRLMNNSNEGVRWVAFHSLACAAPTEMTNPIVLATAARHLCSTEGGWQPLGIELIRAASEQAAGVRPDPYMYHLINQPEWRLPDATNALWRLAPALYTDYFTKNVQ